MIESEVVGKLLTQHIFAGVNANGNSRRLWLLLDACTGQIIRVSNNYGKPMAWRNTPELPQWDITPKCYRDTLQWAKETDKIYGGCDNA